jgi:hypothetical protein
MNDIRNFLHKALLLVLPGIILLTQLPQLMVFRGRNLLKLRSTTQKVSTTNCVLNIFLAGSVSSVEAM